MSNMILRPHSLNAFLSDDDIAKYETSNSVIVPHTFFEDIVNNNVNTNNMFLLGLFYNDKKYMLILIHHIMMNQI